MFIRNGRMEDLEGLVAVEAECFPPEEAAKEEDFRKRLEYYPDHFWVMLEDSIVNEAPEEGRIISFVDGFVTDEPNLTDEMYEKAEMHNENGAWQMIFGVNTLPEYRELGLAGQLIQEAILDAKAAGRKGIVLTCKDELVHYYAKFGFENEGFLGSTHGGVKWNQMRLTF